MAGKINISKEYKDHPTEPYRYKEVKCGRSFYGEIREYKTRFNKDGKRIRIYWAARLPGEHVHTELAWAYDKLMIGKFSEEGIPLTHIGVMVTVDPRRRIRKRELVKDMWLTRWDLFYKHRGNWNYTGHVGPKGVGGSNQWILPQTLYAVKTLPIPEELVLKAIKLTGR